MNRYSTEEKQQAIDLGNIQCLSPAKKYKLYKSSINKSIHFVQRSRAANRDNSVLLLSSTYCYCLDQLSPS